MRLPITALLFLVFLVFLVAVAHAESVVWNSSGVPDLYAVFDNGVHFTISGTTASVQYGARVLLLDDDGNVASALACGSSVPTGSRVAFQFRPHAQEDIS